MKDTHVLSQSCAGCVSLKSKPNSSRISNAMNDLIIYCDVYGICISGTLERLDKCKQNKNKKSIDF